MQEGSPVTNSDVDTQVIHDLMKGRTDLDRWCDYSNSVVVSDCLQSRPPHEYSAFMS